MEYLFPQSRAGGCKASVVYESGIGSSTSISKTLKLSFNSMTKPKLSHTYAKLTGELILCFTSDKNSINIMQMISCDIDMQMHGCRFKELIGHNVLSVYACRKS